MYFFTKKYLCILCTLTITLPYLASPYYSSPFSDTFTSIFIYTWNLCIYENSRSHLWHAWEKIDNTFLFESELFTQYDDPQLNFFLEMAWFHILYGWIKHSCTYIPHFLYPFISCQAPKLIRHTSMKSIWLKIFLFIVMCITALTTLFQKNILKREKAYFAS